MANIPFIAGAVIGGVGLVASSLISASKTKEELKAEELSAETILIVRPKTALQRTATNIVNTLFF